MKKSTQTEPENRQRKFVHLQTGKIFINVYPNTYTEDGILKGSGADKILPAWVIENSKEWEEIPELDYPVSTQFISKTFGKDTVFRIEAIEGTNVVIGSSFGCQALKPISIVNREFKNGNWRVIKDALFTAKDGVKIFEGDSWYYIVDEHPERGIRSSNTLEYKGTSTSPVSRFASYKAASDYLYELLRKPVFTTNDGYEISEGDKYWVVNTANFEPCWENTCRGKTHIQSTWRTFKHENNAREFFLMNKPCLSILEVAEIYATATHKFKGEFSKQGRALRKLVQNKLK